MPSEFKLNLKDAMQISRSRDVLRKCKNCNKPFLLTAKLGGISVECPECHTWHKVKYEIRFDIVLELSEGSNDASKQTMPVL